MTKVVPTLHEELLAPRGPDNPRNGRGAIAHWPDGRLIFTYARFHGGADHDTADIWARFSADDGYTWGAPFRFMPNIGACNTVSTNFISLPSGDLLWFFAIKHDQRTATHPHVIRSADGGQTWSSPVLIAAEAGYFVVNNDRVIRHSSGRLLVPTAKSGDPATYKYHYHGLVACFFSDDDGTTWQRGPHYLDIDGEAGLQEPGIVERADGSLWMCLRTDKGYVYQSESFDRGETWSAAAPTPLVAPRSPATVARLPGRADLLLPYNDRSGVRFDPGLDHSQQFNWRTPLNAVVSSDGGQTWHSPTLVEADESKSYCYTSILFHKDTTLLTYYQGVAGGPNLLDIKYKIVPTAAWTDGV